MLLIQDQREKHGKHFEIENYCKEHNIPILRKRLDVGDYMLGEYAPSGVKPIGKISVDTKQDIAELSNDLYRDKLSFNKKYRKCYEKGIVLIVLVGQNITSISEILAWSSPHSKIPGKMLFDMIGRIKRSYNVKFAFCEKKNIGDVVLGMLSGKISNGTANCWFV